MKVSAEQIKTECVERMKKLLLSNDCVKAFQNGEIWMSEGFGALYEITNDEELKARVAQFESDGMHKVFHIIHNVTDFGDLYTFLFVYGDDEEWKLDASDIKAGSILAYCWNKTDEYCSEFGSVQVLPACGGMVRIA